MGEPAGPGNHPLEAIQARLDQQIPELYRDLALYLQVLREVLPVCLDQACSHMATQVNPRRYNRLPPEVRQQLHHRLKQLLANCCSLLTVEQLLSLACQMARERRRLAVREEARLLQSLEEGMKPSPAEEGLQISFPPGEEQPAGSIQLHLTPPLSSEPFAFAGQGPEDPEDASIEGEGLAPFPQGPFGSEALPSQEESPPSPDLPWSGGRLPRDPALLVLCLDGWNVALARQLRNLSHGVNLELMRAGLMAGVVPVPLLDAVLTGQVELQAAPPNVLRVPLGPPEAQGGPHPPLGVLLRTVDLEMERPRLRTCRRRLLHHRQEILKMAETSRRLQRRHQAHHAERLWRHDSQLTPPQGNGPASPQA